MTLNLLEAVRAEAPDAVVVGSRAARSTARRPRCPSTRPRRCARRTPTRCPRRPPTCSAGFYADAHGLGSSAPRAFNHAGPGQSPNYAIASFARQVAAGLEAGDDPIRVRDRQPRRPPRLHRRARRRARLPALAAARRAGRLQRLLRPPGLRRRARRARSARTPARDRPRRRPGARARSRGDGGPRRRRRACARATGWQPEIPLERTLADTVAWWREQIRARASSARPRARPGRPGARRASPPSVAAGRAPGTASGFLAGLVSQCSSARPLRPARGVAPSRCAVQAERAAAT